jgi:hypothetical protein
MLYSVSTLLTRLPQTVSSYCPCGISNLLMTSVLVSLGSEWLACLAVF